MGNKGEVKKILSGALAVGRNALTDLESKQILTAYDIPIPKQGLAKTNSKAVKIAEKLGYPVALKVVSPDILHKTDAGGVKLHLDSPEKVEEAYMEILRKVKEYRSKANVWGVLVEKMVEKAREVIVGMKRDLTFGPIVLFGLGGIFTEVLKDTSLRSVPLSREDAVEMVREIRGYSILEAYRGQPPADIDSVVDLIIKIAHLSQDFQMISEMDLNPVFLREKNRGLIVVDARIIL